MKPLLLLLSLLAATAPATAQPVQQPDDTATEVEGLVVTARALRHDPSRATTACVFAALPASDRDPLWERAGAIARAGPKYAGPKIGTVKLSREGVASALRACGAPDTAGPARFATAALRFYAVERSAAARLAESRLGDDQLDRAWGGLPQERRETLSEAGYRMYEGGGDDEDAEEAALVVFGLIRSVRPLSAFNPLFYKRSPTAWRLVFHFASRGAREALEKGF